MTGSSLMEAHPKPVIDVSEGARERETFKYEPFLYTDVQFNDGGQLLPSSQIVSSSDSILTGLAQLGAYQTGTERSFISLFDTDYQYVIAESVPSMPLTPKLPSDKCPLPLFHCGTAIPRKHGTCEHVLFLEAETDVDQFELPLSFIANINTDERLNRRPYCQFGEAGQFYAAVPIRTRKGINIGSYCVLSTTVPVSWGDHCVRHLRDTSRAIMYHLETNRLKHAYRRNERMTRGFGSFLEGKSTLSGWQTAVNRGAFKDNDKLEGSLNFTQQVLEMQSQREIIAGTENESKMSPEPNERTQDRPASKKSRGLEKSKAGILGTPLQLPVGGGSINEDSHAKHANPTTNGNASGNETKQVLSKAANIVREAFEVAGCLFFDVSLGSYQTPKFQSRAPDRTPDAVARWPSSSSSGDEQFLSSPDSLIEADCELLGFSTSDKSSINADILSRSEYNMPRRLLAKLIRRYPKGKIFNFDSIGELLSSDSSEDDGILQLAAERTPPRSSEDNGKRYPSTTSVRTKKIDGRFGRAKEGAHIRRIFPGACSVAFVPAWDTKRERWLAGGFVYTLAATRVFTTEGELSSFRAFTKLAIAEIQGLSTLRAERAKSDALGALSHELRSPLHGVILGTELLNDTDLSVFQGNATHTIETCCRTLLDTIDHLLDYAKINHISTAARTNQKMAKMSPYLLKKANSNPSGHERLYSTSRLDRIVEEVVESIFAGFNFQQKSVRQISQQSTGGHFDTLAHVQSDSAQAMEQLEPSIESQGEPFSNISVYLSIQPDCDWTFHLPAGAVRRIVMNLFGNSLKYTHSGAVNIGLTQVPSATSQHTAEQLVKLTIQDSGIGISEDYLQHDLFTPFAQENELSPGTGLGLSLVKKIVSNMRGQVFVESRVGFGTTATVVFPLQPSNMIDLPREDLDFEEQLQELQGLRVKLLGFKRQDTGHKIAEGRTLVESICCRSLGLDLVSEDQTLHLAPELVLWSDDVLPVRSEGIDSLSKFPNVVVCQDALVARHLSDKFESLGQRSVFEFVSQPIGPRKLAKSIQVAYKRWMDMPKFLSTSSRTSMLNRLLSSDSISLSRGVSTTDRSEPKSPSQAEAIVERPAASSTTTELQAPQKEGTSRITASSVHGQRKILLVDDNHINIKVLCACMRKFGHEYEMASNGQEAVDAYVQNPSHFIAVLMDISMPIMNGLEATRHIRTHEYKSQLSRVKIFALTGLASETAYHEAMQSGVDVFLTKPVRPNLLRDMLKLNGVLSPQQAVQGDDT